MKVRKIRVMRNFLMRRMRAQKKQPEGCSE